MPRSRNPEGEFNTRGQTKCPHCSNYFPDAWADSHVGSCPKNPANQASDDDDEGSTGG